MVRLPPQDWFQQLDDILNVHAKMHTKRPKNTLSEPQRERLTSEDIVSLEEKMDTHELAKGNLSLC